MVYLQRNLQMSTTLLELKTQARQLADMEDNEFVSDSELVNYINFAIAELQDLLIHSGSEYFLSELVQSTVVNQDSYDLPADFYKLKGIDAKLNGSHWMSLRPFNFNERNRFDDFGAWTMAGISNVRYRIMGNKVRFTPIPDANIEYRLYYVPKASKLSTDADTLDDVNQYSDFVIVTAAMKMLAKEESDVSLLASERQRLIERIQSDAKDRDMSQPESISDIHSENNEYFYWTSRG